jgi:hypothetical protein
MAWNHCSKIADFFSITIAFNMPTPKFETNTSVCCANTSNSDAAKQKKFTYSGLMQMCL